MFSIPGSTGVRARSLLLIVLLNSAAHILGSPTHPNPPSVNSTGVITLSQEELAAFAPFTNFAKAVYCHPNTVENWSCPPCRANADFQPTLTGGDGNTIQYYFVGYRPEDNSVVVAHQGTNPAQLVSDLTDVDFAHTALDPTLFPGVSSAVTVHQGFAIDHLHTAATILAETRRLISTMGATSVTLIGHSLGGALAELDSLLMSLNLPADIAIKGVVYGTPRVGNQAFADLIDALVPDFTRVNYNKDIVPILPLIDMGFSHPHGEVHLLADGQAVSCPGDDDQIDEQCTYRSVPSVFAGNILDHLGPYDGIYLAIPPCTP